jgi:hypothetical protein
MHLQYLILVELPNDLAPNLVDSFFRETSA